jgi:hypothetical protein
MIMLNSTLKSVKIHISASFALVSLLVSDRNYGEGGGVGIHQFSLSFLTTPFGPQLMPVSLAFLYILEVKNTRKVPCERQTNR